MNVVVDKSDYEIERGKPMPSKNHAYVQTRIIKLLDRKYLDDIQTLSELSLEIDGKEKVPDIAIYKEITFEAGKDILRMKTLPLAVVEILSPKQSVTDLIVKSHVYLSAGVKSYWLVLPDLETIYVYHKIGTYKAFFQNDILKDTVLGIELDLGQLF